MKLFQFYVYISYPLTFPILLENKAVLELKCAEQVEQKETDSHVTAYVMGRVRETGQRYATIQSYCLDRPHLDIKVSWFVVLCGKYSVL